MSLQNAYLRLNIKWADRLGSAYAQYRLQSPDPFVMDFSEAFGSATPPTAGGAHGPIGSLYSVGTIMALFDASISLAFNAPSKFANSLFSAIVNPTAVKPLDYLVGLQGTFFVASTEPLKPILCVQCNRVCSFSRPTPMPASPNFYAGDLTTARTTLATSVPCSQLQGTKGERNAAEQLPTDSRMQWSEILLPAFPGLLLRQGDRITDDIGRNFVVSACELSDLGWRLTSELVDA